MRMCDHWSTDSYWLHFEHLKFLNFEFNAYPDPAFHCNAATDPASQNNADLCGSKSTTLLLVPWTFRRHIDTGSSTFSAKGSFLLFLVPVNLEAAPLNGSLFQQEHEQSHHTSISANVLEFRLDNCHRTIEILRYRCIMILISNKYWKIFQWPS